MKNNKAFLFSAFIFLFLVSITGMSCSSNLDKKSDNTNKSDSEVVDNIIKPEENLAITESEKEKTEIKKTEPEKVLPPVEKATDLTDLDFHSTINKGVVLVDFWAAWCAPCRTQGPIVDEVAKEMGHKAKVTKLNVDNYNSISAEYNVRNIPTIIIFKDGKQALRFVGVQQKDFLIQQIEQLL